MQIVSVAIEVLLHPCQQKSLLLLLKGINLKERSASINFVRDILKDSANKKIWTSMSHLKKFNRRIPM